MDYLDQQILIKLKENARQSASDISKEIHLSVSTVIDRIRKMESSGIIKSYTVITDEHKTGNDVTALMEISLEHPRYNELFIENIKKNPNIISCYYLTGEFDYLLKIACQSSEHLEQIHQRSGWCTSDTYSLCPAHRKKYLFFPSGSNRTLISERNFYEKYEAYFRSCRGRDTDCPLSAHLSFFPYGQ